MKPPKRKTCHLCGTKISLGDYTTKHRGRHVHADCGTYEPFDVRSTSNTGRERDNQPAFTVTGQRNHERHCNQCHLTHAGVCF